MTDCYLDPWTVFKNTQLPVFYEIRQDQSLLIHRQIMPVSQVHYLTQFSQIPELVYPDPQTPPFRHHSYVLDGLSQKGYNYLVIQESLAKAFQDVHPSRGRTRRGSPHGAL